MLVKLQFSQSHKNNGILPAFVLPEAEIFRDIPVKLAASKTNSLPRPSRRNAVEHEGLAHLPTNWLLRMSDSF